MQQAFGDCVDASCDPIRARKVGEGRTLRRARHIKWNGLLLHFSHPPRTWPHRPRIRFSRPRLWPGDACLKANCISRGETGGAGTRPILMRQVGGYIYTANGQVANRYRKLVGSTRPKPPTLSTCCLPCSFYFLQAPWPLHSHPIMTPLAFRISRVPCCPSPPSSAPSRAENTTQPRIGPMPGMWTLHSSQS